MEPYIAGSAKRKLSVAKSSKSWAESNNGQHPTQLVRNNPNITLRAGIDFKMIGKLAAESRHLNSLALAKTADIDAGRGAYE